MTNEELFPSLLKIIESGKAVNLKINGWSMSPLLYPERDSIILAKTKGQLKRGDVVLYRRDNGKYIVHRIYKIKRKTFFTIGDAETAIEGPLNRNQILASAIGAYRKKRYFDFGSFKWKAFSYIWLLVRPFRPCIWRIVAKFYRLLANFR
ncbi:MAG: S24/S26 family peptidase [Lachnospiraceae bacterium]|nr:S24/S26 family peptidase [Lachnospiraceae bacterium]